MKSGRVSLLEFKATIIHFYATQTVRRLQVIIHHHNQQSTITWLTGTTTAWQHFGIKKRLHLAPLTHIRLFAPSRLPLTRDGYDLFDRHGAAAAAVAILSRPLNNSSLSSLAIAVAVPSPFRTLIRPAKSHTERSTSTTTDRD